MFKKKNLSYQSDFTFQYFFKLNLEKIWTSQSKGVRVYLYTNGHVLIPRDSEGLYGSAMKHIGMDLKTGYHKKFYIQKNRAVRVDRIGQRCVTGGAKERVGHCIVRYLEDNHLRSQLGYESDANCTSYHLMADKTKTFCDKYKSGLIADTLDIWKTWPEVDILDRTGCLPHCERDEISLQASEESRSWKQTKNPTLTMIFLFKDGTYQFQEEYVVYDFNDFIADVGGYLGLLLGHSVLSIYHMSVEWFALTKVWRSLFKG